MDRSTIDMKVGVAEMQIRVACIIAIMQRTEIPFLLAFSFSF